jgi:hypothetical protein
MTRWPPIVWPIASIASIFILMAFRKPGAMIGGFAVAIVVLCIALYLALKSWPNRPRPPAFTWAIVGLTAWYVVAAAAGAIVGARYAVAALLAGIIPLTALCLLLATTRVKTVEAGDGRLVDTTPQADRDPAPGIGMDDETPLGDTTEHSDAERVAKPSRRFERRGEGARRR